MLDPQRPSDDGPPPMPWDEYADQVDSELNALLGTDPDEEAMQRFFEKHPSKLPGAFPGAMGHGAFPHALITQPDIAGIGHRRPDFMWLARHSASINPVLVEIESPTKLWIAGPPRDQRQSAPLTHALNQLRQWAEWLDEPANRLVFQREYGIPEGWLRVRSIRPQFWLLYGRRAENPDEIARLRRYLADHGQTALTYDSLPSPNRWCQDYMTVRRDTRGTFKVVHLPPTANWVASSPEEWRAVSGREDAVLRCDGITDARRSWLLEQVAEWDRWAEDALNAQA